MKHFLLAIGIIFSASSFAGAGLPSRDSEAVQNAIQQAKLDQKNMIIFSSAAWCSPCAQLHAAMNESTTTTDTMKKNYRVVRIEDTNKDTGLLTFLPFRQYFYPNIFYFNVNTNQMYYLTDFEGATPAQRLDKLLPMIQQLDRGFDLRSDSMKRFELAIAQGKEFLQKSDEATNLFMEVTLNALTSATSTEAHQRVEAILALIAKNPKLFSEINAPVDGWIRMIYISLYRFEIENNFKTIDEVAKVYPGISSGLNGRISGRANLLVKSPLYSELAKSDYKTAASQCRQLADGWRRGENKNDKGYAMTSLYVDSFCWTMEVQAGLASVADYEKWVEASVKLVPKDKLAEANEQFAYSLVSVDSFTFANQQIDSILLKAEKTYNSDLADIQAAIAEAQASGNQQALVDAQNELDSLNHFYEIERKSYLNKRHFWSQQQKSPLVEYLN